MSWVSSRPKTAALGGSWYPHDMNAVQDAYVRSAGITADDFEDDIPEQLGLGTTASGHAPAGARRGTLAIATEESRTNAAYGLLTTPDSISVVLPANGLIHIGYKCLIKNTVAAAGRMAIFLNSTQMQMRDGATTAPRVNEAGVGGSVNEYYAITTATETGLARSAFSQLTDDVTTGQVLTSQTTAGNLMTVFAAAGSYTVSAQFKATSGTVTVKNRQLWVRVQGF